MITYTWQNLHGVTQRTFDCGYCGHRVAPNTGWAGTARGVAGPQKNVEILICPNCTQPTYFDYERDQHPAVRMGADLKNLPAEIAKLYGEARDASGVRAYTACVMACRKILMNLAVLEKAPENQSFVEYVDYLVKNGFVPPKGRDWVDRIRKKGNEANHEIALMGEADARDILGLVEMLLRFNFELGTPPAVAKPA